MAFVAVSLEKGPGLESWLSKVLQGFANAKDDQLSFLADSFDITEADKLETNEARRLFLIRSAWSIPNSLWIIGFMGGSIAYILRGVSGWLVVPALLVLTAWFFTSSFLKWVTKLSLRKHGYEGEAYFYSAEEIISMAGMRKIADIKEEAME